MEDRQIVNLYFERIEDAISETEKKYGRYCHYIAYQILGDDEDSKEIVNDMYLKVWNTIPPTAPEHLKPYVGMITRQLALNRYEMKKAKKRGGQVPLVLDELSECISSHETESVESELVLTDIINRFLESLSEKSRNIFIRRYWYMSDVVEIAKDYSMTETSVNVSLFRSRKKFKIFLEKEGVYL